MDAPNPLKIRATDSLTDEEINRQIAESVAAGREMLNREKLRRDAVQLCVQWRMLEQRSPGTLDFSELLVRIGRLGSEMKARAILARQHAAPQWCDRVEQSVLALIGLTHAMSPDKTVECRAPLGLLGQAVLALSQMFAADEVQPARMVELDDLVSRRSARSAAA